MTTRMKLVSVLAVAATLTATGLAATSASAKGGSYHPVHGAGSSHNPIVYHPVHGQGSSHNPIVLHKKPPIPGKPTHPPCPAGSTVYNSDTGQCS
jgi:hypothetical protein